MCINIRIIIILYANTYTEDCNVCLVFETRSYHCSSGSGLVPIIQARLALTSQQFSCLNLWSAAVIYVYHHSQMIIFCIIFVLLLPETSEREGWPQNLLTNQLIRNRNWPNQVLCPKTKVHEYKWWWEKVTEWSIRLQQSCTKSKHPFSLCEIIC